MKSFRLCMSGPIPGRIFLLAFLFLTVANGKAQTPVGAGETYTTLKAAFDAINAGTLTGAVDLHITSDITETASATLNASGTGSASYTSVTISPSGGVARLIEGSIGDDALIRLNGADNVTINGLRSGGNSLSISNTSTSGVCLLFTNDASENLITNATFMGVNTFTPAQLRTLYSANNTTNYNLRQMSGVISFGNNATSGTGNDNNTISYCDIRDGASTPSVGISAYNTFTSANSGNTISHNNIYNYYRAQAGAANILSAGIFLYDQTSDWTISDNSLYQTSDRSHNVSCQFGGIYVTYWMYPAGNLLIKRNYIGGSTANAGGAPTSYNCTVQLATGFMPIRIRNTTASLCTIEENVIRNISFTSTDASTQYSYFGAIEIDLDSRVYINNNTIGSESATGSIVCSTGATGNQTISGVYFRGAIGTIENNKIGGYTINCSGSTFNGVYVSRRGGTDLDTLIIKDNTIGSLTLAGSVTGTATASCNGINLQISLNTRVTGNTVSNFLNTGPVRGINVSAAYTTWFKYTEVLNNTVCRLESTGATIGLAEGISVYTTDADHTINISNNTVHSLGYTGSTSGASYLTRGISILRASFSAFSTISGNKLYSFFNRSNNTSDIYGIYLNAIAVNLYNNMISLGYDPDGVDISNNPRIYGIAVADNGGLNGYNGAKNFYNNTVFIGGNVTGAGTYLSSALRINTGSTINSTIKNNIFAATRTYTTPGTRRTSCIDIETTTGASCFTEPSTTILDGTFSLDHNLYYFAGNGTRLFTNGTTTYSSYGDNLNNFRAAFPGQDNNSIAADPNLVNPAGTAAAMDLHINSTTGSPAESAGTVLVEVTGDIDGQVRADFTPADIGADAGNFTLIDATGPGIAASKLSHLQYGSTDKTLVSVTLFDPSGIAPGANAPHIYYRKTTGSWLSAAGSLTGSTSNGAVYDFTISTSALGGIAPGDVIEYYLVAQDNSGNISSWPAGAVATNVTSVTTPPSTAITRFNVSMTLSGNYNIGSSEAAPFNSLVSAFNTYQTAYLSGPVTYTLTDASYSLGTSTAILKYNQSSSATNTLTIKPATGVSPVITSTVAGPVIQLLGADHIIIDGSNNGTVSRDLSITNNSVSGSVIHFANGGTGCDGGNGVNGSTVKNCVLTGNSVTNSSAYGIVAGGNTTATSGVGHDDNSFINNTILKVGTGIYLNNTGTAYSNISISGNEIGSATSTSYVGVTGILIGRINNSMIQNNTILNIKNASSASTGIFLSDASSSGIVVHNNLIHGVQYTGISALAGKGIRTSGTGHTISNNVIFNIGGEGSTTVSNGLFGIYSASTNTNIYHNTVYLAGNYNGNSSTANISAALMIAANGNNIRNNIFHNEIAPAGKVNPVSYAVYSSVTAANITAINYNNYYVAGANGNSLGYLGAARAALSDWKLATGKDVNSINLSSSFSNSSSSAADGYAPAALLQGEAISGYETDFGGAARVSSPSMGAWERVIVLPLTWKSFTGHKKETAVQLNWQTSSEQNTRNFTVQHSTNGREWINIGVVRAAGQSQVTTDYSWLHRNPATGNNMYRLLQTDLDGRSDYSKTVNVLFENNGLSVQVFPNPVVNGRFTVLLPKAVALNLYTTAGSLALSKQGVAGMQQLDVSMLAGGVYYLQAGAESIHILIR